LENNHLKIIKNSFMQWSHWEWDSYFRDTDVVIIGSGIVGLSAAIFLTSNVSKLRVTIFERGILPSGASTRNAGFTCFGSITELLDDLGQSSENAVLQLVEKRWHGLQRLRALAGDTALDYQMHGAYEMFKPDEQTAFGECMERIDFLNKKIAPITGEKQTFSLADEQIEKFGFGGIEHLIYNRSEGQLNTGQMMTTHLRIAREKGVNILNGVTVKSVNDSANGVILQTENGWEIKTKKVLVATNGFTRHLLPDLQITPARNQVLITQSIDNLSIKGCFHYDKGYVYFRNVGNRLLLGGGRNHHPKQETTDQFGTTENIQQYLEKLLREHILPNKKVEIERRWSGILGIGERKSPIIEHISENVVVAARLGGMGIAIGTLTGEEGAQLLL